MPKNNLVVPHRKVNEIYIAGVATDYCVKYSSLDAVAHGYRTYVIIDACRGVGMVEDDIEKAICEMVNYGVHIITSTRILTV